MTRTSLSFRALSLPQGGKSLIVALVLGATSLAACAQAPQASGNAGTSKAIVNFQSCAKPMYPEEDLRAGHDGTVTLSFLVGVDGKAKEAKVTKSSGYRAMDEAARDAILKCEFKPATKDGKPVETWVPIQYVWTHR